MLGKFNKGLLVCTVFSSLGLMACGTKDNLKEVGSSPLDVPLTLQCPPNYVPSGVVTQEKALNPNLANTTYGIQGIAFICRNKINNTFIQTPIVGANNGTPYNTFNCPFGANIYLFLGANNGFDPRFPFYPQGYNPNNSVSRLTYSCKFLNNLSISGLNSKYYGYSTVDNLPGISGFYNQCLPTGIKSVIINGIRPDGGIGNIMGVQCF